MSIQLLLIGFVLHWVFALDRLSAVLGLGMLMTVVAGVAAVRRTEYRHAGIWLDSLISVWASSWLMAGLALLAVIQVEPWYRPQYSIPLLS